MDNELEKAALDYAKNHSAAPDKETPDWIVSDFKAGALWMDEKYNSVRQWIKEQIKNCIDEYVKPENEIHQGQIAMEHMTYEIILKQLEII